MFASSVSPTSTPPSPGSILSESPSSAAMAEDHQAAAASVTSSANNLTNNNSGGHFKKKSSPNPVQPSPRELFFSGGGQERAAPATVNPSAGNGGSELKEVERGQDNLMIYVEEVSAIGNVESRL